MNHRPSISLIITTYNRPDALRAVVRACFSQTEREFEIIITDDGSTEETVRCIAELKAASPVPLTHVWQPDDGFRAAAARNKGILAAKGDYVVFLDGDCIPQSNFIARHRALAEPGYLVSGSRILLSPGLTDTVLQQQLDLQRTALVRKLGYRLKGDLNKFIQLLLPLPDAARKRNRFSWRRIKSCNLGVWRRDLVTVNGFDESFVGWGHEDSDLVVRLFNAGVMRKDGAFATEVFHLWHREFARNQESGNRQLVLQRAADKTVRAVQGLAEHARDVPA